MGLRKYLKNALIELVRAHGTVISNWLRMRWIDVRAPVMRLYKKGIEGGIWKELYRSIENRRVWNQREMATTRNAGCSWPSGKDGAMGIMHAWSMDMWISWGIWGPLFG